MVRTLQKPYNNGHSHNQTRFDDEYGILKAILTELLKSVRLVATLPYVCVIHWNQNYDSRSHLSLMIDNMHCNYKWILSVSVYLRQLFHFKTCR